MFEGLEYSSVEHAYQAAKTTDIEKRKDLIKSANTAAKAKKYGRAFKLRDDWESVKVSVMEVCLKSKFSNPSLRAKLDATKGFELEEGNWWGDIIWGVCEGKGQNLLGKLLMKVRDAN